ncbi:concanavalin A-like lectin/glucanase domain-containing protein [Gigaspora rosea]|uniref:Concanavalin A-like lectin/glucanase domain-containing protein n=1 Tax=Gigaspora rosea TaxID=44941 RepID=A0A397U3D2_9GLOM|nr:concanavalin A-like lectin/glucanase domain-containing protein [Gigaspora rosea]
MEESASCNNIILTTSLDFDDELQFLSIDADRLSVKYIGPDDYKVVAVALANNPILQECGVFYFEVKIIDKGENGMIGVGFCTKQSLKTISSNTESDDSNIILMPGLKDVIISLGQEKNSWSYHGDDGYSFSSKSGKLYGPPYTIDDIIGCYLNYRNKIIFYIKNG